MPKISKNSKNNKIHFFQKDVAFWKKALFEINFQSSSPDVESETHQSKSKKQHGGYTSLTDENDSSNNKNRSFALYNRNKAYLSSKKIINRAFAVIYYSPNITINGMKPDIDIPIAHYLARGYDVRFDLSALNEKQRDLFWRELIGEDNLAQVEIKTRSSFLSKLLRTTKLDTVAKFLNQTFNVVSVRHPYPAVTTNFVAETALRIFAMLAVTGTVVGLSALAVTTFGLGIIAVPLVPAGMYVLYQGAKKLVELIRGKEKIFSTLFKFKKDSNENVPLRVRLNQKTKQLSFSLKSEQTQDSSLENDLATIQNPTYAEEFKTTTKYKLPENSVCVVKVTPQTLKMLKDNPQGISEQQLDLPPSAAVKLDEAERQNKTETFIRTNQSLLKHAPPSRPSVSDIPLVVVRASQPAKSVVIGLPTTIQPNLNNFNFAGLKSLNIQSQFMLGANPCIKITINRSLQNHINIFIFKDKITFSQLPLNDETGRLVIKQVAIALSYLRNPNASEKTEEERLREGIAILQSVNSQNLFTNSYNNNLQSELNDYIQFWNESLTEINRVAIESDSLDSGSDSEEELSESETSSVDTKYSVRDFPIVDYSTEQPANRAWTLEEDDATEYSEDATSDSSSSDDSESVEEVEFSSLSTYAQRKAITQEIADKLSANDDKAFEQFLSNPQFIYNDARKPDAYKKGDPIVERAQAFLIAADLWLFSNINLYADKNAEFIRGSKTTHNELREKLNNLFLEFEAQSIYLPNDVETQQKALNHFLGKMTYLLYKNTKYNANGKLNEDDALQKLYKELALAEALTVWQQGREEILVTHLESKKVGTDQTYTSLQIDYPISEITQDQYNELKKIFDVDPKGQPINKHPDWFENKKLPEFAKYFLKKTLAENPDAPANQMHIASFEDVKLRYKSMPATLKRFLGVSNISESHYLIFDQNKRLISQSIEDRSSSLAANEMHNLDMQKRVAIHNARQMYLGEKKQKALQLRDDYQNFWQLTNAEKNNLPEKYRSHAAPIVLSASVLSPEGEPAKLLRSVISEINIDMLNVKDYALEIIDEESYEDKAKTKPIVHLMGSNHIINGVRHWPRSLTQHLSIKARRNSVYYLEQMEFLSHIAKNRAAINPFNQEEEKDLAQLQGTLEELKIALDTHEGLRRMYGVIPVLTKDYKFDDISDQFKKDAEQYWVWAAKIEAILEKFPANSINDVNAFVTRFGAIFGGRNQAKDFLCGLHALVEYVKITNLAKENDPVFFGEDKNINLYRSALERVFIRKMHGRSHVACKSGKDRTGMAKLLADAIEKFWAIHGCIPQYNNQAHWEMLMNYAADEFISKHHQIISQLNSQGADGLKSLKGMIPELLKKLVMQKIEAMEKLNRGLVEDEKPEEDFGKAFFEANKLGSSLNKPHPEFFDSEELSLIKQEVNLIDKSANYSDEYLIEQLINPKLADILRRALAGQIDAHSNLLDWQKIDRLNEAVFRKINFDACLYNVGLEHLSTEDKHALEKENENIADKLLSSKENDESLLTRIWQFSKRQPEVFAKSQYAGILEIKSLKELVQAHGIDGIKPKEEMEPAFPYLIPTKVDLKPRLEAVPADVLNDCSVTIGLSR